MHSSIEYTRIARTAPEDIMKHLYLISTLLLLALATDHSYAQVTADFTTGAPCEVIDIEFDDNSTFTSGSTGAKYTFYSGNGYKTTVTSLPLYYSYGTAGTYTVSWVVEDGNGNRDSIAKDITINKSIKPRIKREVIGIDSIFRLTDTSLIPAGVGYKSRLWRVLYNGATYTDSIIELTFPSPGFYNVRLITETENGCIDSIFVRLLKHDKPDVNFRSQNVCVDSVISIFDSTTTVYTSINRWLWDFGDGDTLSYDIRRDTIYHGYDNPGVYDIKLTVFTDVGFVVSKTRQYTINALPQPSFIANPTCFDSGTQFQNTSSVATGSIASYVWIFGDTLSGSNDTSFLSDPAHVFSDTGRFNVTLFAISDGGCRDSVTQQVVVKPRPRASFGAQRNFCTDSALLFTNTSVYPVTGDTGVSYFYDFGDGTTSTQRNPSHIYSSAGVYNVSFATVARNGCADTVTDAITVTEEPTIDFSVANTCQRQLTSFTATATVTGGGTLSYNWNFGNNTVGSGATPTTTYSLPGDYTVTLTVTTAAGCKSQIKKQVTISATPLADFRTSPSCVKQPVVFSQAITFLPGLSEIESFTWDFGDGSKGLGDTVEHIYNATGTYNVKLTVKAKNGCSESTTLRPVNVSNLPRPGFTAEGRCADSAIQFVDTSKVAGIIFYRFGDGTMGTGAVVSHRYDSAGTYMATQVVQANSGCIDSFTRPVVAFGNPTAAFTFEQNICAGSEFAFANQSKGATSYLWRFGDGNSSTLREPRHTFQAGGYFEVELVAYNSRGCTDTLQITVRARPRPQFNIISFTGCEEDTLQFSPQPLLNTIPINRYLWDFGDGTPTVEGANVKHAYDTPGVYQLTLAATNDSGCVTTVTKPQTVLPKPDINISIIGGQSVRSLITFTDNSTFPGGTVPSTFRQWFIDGQGQGSQQTFTYIFQTPGPHVLRAEVFADGCSRTFTRTLNIIEKPDISFTYDTVCAKDIVLFSDNSTQDQGSIIQRYWDFGDGTTDSGRVVRKVYQRSGTFQARLRVVSTIGFDTSGPFPVRVLQLPEAKFTVEPEVATITKPEFLFRGVSEGNVVSRTWDFGDGFIDETNTRIVAHAYDDTGTYPVRLIVTNDLGCVDTFFKSVRVKQDFQVFAPNIVSNNEDAVNSTFRVYGEGIERFDMIIFNRMGTLMFETTDINEEWDGTHNGIRVPEGPYYYYIKLTDYEGELLKKVRGYFIIYR